MKSSDSMLERMWHTSKNIAHIVVGLPMGYYLPSLVDGDE